MISDRFKRQVLPAGLCLALAALASPAARAEDTTLAIPATSLGFLSRYIAEDQHLWSKEGLNVKILNIAGIGAMNAVIAGSADFSINSAQGITRAWAKGQKLAALLTASDRTGESIVVRKDIAEAAHFDANAPLATRGKVLKGRRIATGPVGGLYDVVLRVFAKDVGLDPEVDIVEAAIQNPEFVSAFEAKRIDGFLSSPPFAEQVSSDGTGTLVTDARKEEPIEFTPFANGMLLARADFCAGHQSVCEKMVHGLYEATRIIRNDPRTSLAVIKAHFGGYDDKVLQASYETVKTMTAENPITTAEELENGDKMSIAAGFLKPEDKLPDYQPLIDNSYVK